MVGRVGIDPTFRLSVLALEASALTSLLPPLWAWRDLNPRPPDYESGASTKLSYKPGILVQQAFFNCLLLLL